MNAKTNFGKTDIGAEILQILTTGLYRDPLDTLREYVQNSIDADSSQINISIDNDVISITDNGNGMNSKEAVKAIRLGISDKNPSKNVGFRGIGIYSGFNVCDRVEIFTHSKSEELTYRIVFEFGAIKLELEEEQNSRLNGNPPQLFLEGLMEKYVFVENLLDETDFMPTHGTKVILSGLNSEVYQKLNNWDEVTDYLQSVVPLPFNEENFRFAKILEQAFQKEDYNVVALTLKIADKEEKLFRPYTDFIFTNGGSKAPEPFISDIKIENGESYGFVWVCANDYSSVLKDKKIRGLLIKKRGFSIANRQYLEPYFGRPVVSRRITGEVIVTHPELIPNAARSDFENNVIYQKFLQTLVACIRKIDTWAIRHQDRLKTLEKLTEIELSLNNINNYLLAAQRDNKFFITTQARLEEYSSELTALKTSLLEESDKLYLEKIGNLIDEIKKFVEAGILSQREKATKVKQNFREERIKAIQRRQAAIKEGQTITEQEAFKSLTKLLESCGITYDKKLEQIINYIDTNILKANLDQNTYSIGLAELLDFIEDRL